MVRKSYLLAIDQKSHRQVGERPISIARKKYTGNGMKGVRNLSDTLTSVDLSYPDNYRFYLSCHRFYKLKVIDKIINKVYKIINNVYYYL